MSIKTALTAFILAAIPTFGLAEGCRNGADHDQQAMSCVPGTLWDAESSACVPVASS